MRELEQLTRRVERLEKLLIALTEDYSINHMPICEIPHATIEEEDVCEAERVKDHSSSADEYTEEDTTTIIRGQD